MNLTILVGIKKDLNVAGPLYSTAYNRWNESLRFALFSNLSYQSTAFTTRLSAIPKTGVHLENVLLDKLFKHDTITSLRTKSSGDVIYYHSGGRYYRKCLRHKLSNEYKELLVLRGAGDAVLCLLSSSLYYWLWIVFSDCYHVTRPDIDMTPVPQSLVGDKRFQKLANRLLTDLERHAERRVRRRADGSLREEVNYYVGKSKSVLDEIDRVLAEHYKLAGEELDFILNYDIKYRMGQEEAEEDE